MPFKGEGNSYGFYLHPAVSSQPVNAHCEDVGGDGKVTVESFTQPSTFDEIVLGTQIPCTPGASQALLVLCLSSI